MMCMADRNCERIGGIWSFDLDARQLKTNHMFYLLFFGMADADDGLLHCIGKILSDRDCKLGRNKKGYPPRLPELQSGDCILIDERLLNSREIWTECLKNLCQSAMQP